jgi:hypothetical protein
LERLVASSDSQLILKQLFLISEGMFGIKKRLMSDTEEARALVTFEIVANCPLHARIAALQQSDEE